MKKNKILPATTNDDYLGELKPSYLIYIHIFILGVLFYEYYLPPIIAAFYFFKIETWKYTFNTKTILETYGVFSSTTTETHYYRIKSVNIEEPFFYRIFGLGNLIITSSDPDKRTLIIRGIRQTSEIRNSIRDMVQLRREEMGVTEHELFKM